MMLGNRRGRFFRAGRRMDGKRFGQANLRMESLEQRHLLTIAAALPVLAPVFEDAHTTTAGEHGTTSGDQDHGGSFSNPGHQAEFDAADAGDNLIVFNPIAPLGSLIYDPPIAASIDVVGEIDSYPATYDAGQTITVIVIPSATLRPEITLQGPPSESEPVTQTASGPGIPVVIQTHATTFGQYDLTVAGADSTTGDYTIEFVLNAAVEVESLGLQTNNDPASAQDIDASFISLGVGNAARGAVMGRTDPSRTVLYSANMEQDPGWILEGGPGAWEYGIPTGGGNRDPFGGFTGSHVVGLNLDGDYASSMEPIYASLPPVSVSGLDDVVLTFQRWLNVEGPEFDRASIEASADGENWTTVWENTAAVRDVNWTSQSVDLSAIAQGQVVIYLRFGMGATDSTLQYGGWNIDDLEITSSSARQPDWYRFSIDDGSNVTIVASPLEPGDLNLSLYSADGSTQLAQGYLQTDGTRQVISFIDETSDGTPTDYLLKIEGGGGSYSVLVARSTDFDVEPNNDTATAQSLYMGADRSLALLGHVNSAAVGATDVDYLQFPATEGANLVVTIAVPANGPGEPVNDLIPAALLITPDNQEIPIDGQLAFEATLSGTYYVRIAAADESFGTYVAYIQGARAVTAPFAVTGTDWDDSLVSDKRRTQITVQFSDLVLLPTLSPDDLTFNGVPATGVTIVDGRTVIFDLPDVYVEGSNTVSIAADALSDIQGIPLDAFTLDYLVGDPGPRVTGISVGNGILTPSGDVDVVVQFSEDIVVSQLDAADIRLHGTLTGDRDFSALEYNAANRELTISYLALPEDHFTLTLRSGDGRFESPAGFDLDGEVPSGTIPPEVSGDGLAGGDFVWDFETDIVARPFEGGFTAIAPEGTLVYEAVDGAFIGNWDAGDQFLLPLDEDQLITVVVWSETSLQPLVSFWLEEGTILGEATAASPGRPAVLTGIPIAAAGDYTIDVQGAAGSGGEFTVRVILNAGLEAESWDGPENYVHTFAQDLNPLFTPLEDNKSRASVLGQTEAGTLPVSLRSVDFGAQWKYLDDGSDQGTAWREPAFDDSTWASGAGQLGYGDGDEATLVSFGDDEQQKHITTYFRHAFVLEDQPERFDNLILDLIRDDGVAVYLNGTEIFRDNLAFDATFDTVAASSINGGAEQDVIHHVVDLSSLPDGLLRSGENVLAVEIHQQSDSSSDISFDMQLELVDVLPIVSTFSTLAFVTAGSTWRYLDDGTDQDTVWRDPDFDDSGWSSGDAQLGYGDDDEVTVIGFGPDDENKFITTYFRQEFELDGNLNQLERLVVRLLKDDGAAVYLNGHEIVRDNLAPNAAWNDLASGPVSGSDEDVFTEFLIDTASLPDGVLRTGRNVIAVEVHQQSPDSSDLSFDLSITGELIDSREIDRKDWYSFELNDGEMATIGLHGLTSGDLSLELFGSDGQTRLATSTTKANVDYFIRDFRDTTNDGLAQTYFLRIDGDPAEYNLFVTRGVSFDVEPNRSFTEAQPATAVLGAISGLSTDDSTLLTDFAGINLHSAACNCEPPDTHVAAGPNHIVEVVNTAIAVYNKDGSVAMAPRSIISFFRPDIVLSETFEFDPVVTFDSQAGRFVVAVLLGPVAGAAETDLLYAVSDSDDPTAGWSEQHRVDFSVSDPREFADYPKLGWNADAFVVTVNMFNTSNDFTGTNVVVIHKSAALDRDSSTNARTVTKLDSDTFTMAAATMHDAIPGAPMWFVQEATYAGGNQLRVVRMTRTLSAQPVFTNFDVDVPEYTRPPIAQQPFGVFATGDSRMLNAEWRDGRLVATHNTGVNGRAAVSWYEFSTLSANPTLVQSGRITGSPDKHTYYPSIAINKAGDIGMTYMQSSETELVSMYVVGQAANAPAGQLSSPVLVRAGERPYLGRRGGDYSGISVDPIRDTFWAGNEVMLDIGSGVDWSTWIGEFSVSQRVEEDWYSIYSLQDETVSVNVTLPFAGARLPEFDLVPVIEIYSPENVLVLRSSDLPPEEQRSFDFTATMEGEYRVRVVSDNGGTGPYLLTLDGTTSDGMRPAVIHTTPFDGKRVLELPEKFVIDFSEPILLTSLDASDLVVGGVPAVSFTVLNGKQVEFLLDPLTNVGEGVYNVEIAEGAILDLSGAPLVAYSGTIIVDTSGPRILSSRWNGTSIPQTPVFATGEPLKIEFQFDEPLLILGSPRRGVRSPGNEDIVLTDEQLNVYTPSTISFDGQTNIFTIEYLELPAGNYQLRLVSGDNAFEDLLGNDFDGEPALDTIDATPTGDGIVGGDYLVNFSLDDSITTVDAFEDLLPLGSLTNRYRGELEFLSPVDLQRIEVAVLADQPITVLLRPDDPAAVGSINGTIANSPGETVAYFLRPTADGTVVFDVRSSIPSGYQLEIYRNAAVEEALGESTSDNPVSLDDYVLSVGNGLVTAIGDTQSVPASTITLFSEDFSDGLGQIVLDGGLWHLSTGRSEDGLAGHSVPNSLYYGQNETSLGEGTYDTGTTHGGAVLLPQIELPLADQVRLTFQHFLDRDASLTHDIAEIAVDAGAGFVTLASTSLESLAANTGGLWESVLVDLTPYAGQTVQVRIAFDTVDDQLNSFEGWYIDDIAITADLPEQPHVDVYEVDLSPAAGQTVDIVLVGQDGVDYSQALVELIDAEGNVVAVASPTLGGIDLENLDTAIVGFEIPTTVTGDYTVRITSFVTGEYGLTIARGMMFDTEPNEDNLALNLRNVDQSGFVIGHLDEASDPVDIIALTIEPGQAMLVRIGTPVGNPQAGDPLDLSVNINSPGAAIYNTFNSTSTSFTSFVVSFFDTFSDVAEIRANSGRGTYVVEFYLAVRSGDFDASGTWDCADVDQLTTAIALDNFDVTFDLSGDGLLDQTDLVLWFAGANQINLAPGQFYRQGDANLDGFVDASDFANWNSHKFTLTPGWCQGDFNVDGSVDVRDFNIWYANRFQPTSAGIAAPSAMPKSPDPLRTPRAPLHQDAIEVVSTLGTSEIRRGAQRTWNVQRRAAGASVPPVMDLPAVAEYASTAYTAARQSFAGRTILLQQATGPDSRGVESMKNWDSLVDEVFADEHSELM